MQPMYITVCLTKSLDTQRNERGIKRTCIRFYAPHKFALDIFICIFLASIIPQFIRST